MAKHSDTFYIDTYMADLAQVAVPTGYTDVRTAALTSLQHARPVQINQELVEVALHSVEHLYTTGQTKLAITISLPVLPLWLELRDCRIGDDQVAFRAFSFWHNPAAPGQVMVDLISDITATKMIQFPAWPAATPWEFHQGECDIPTCMRDTNESTCIRSTSFYADCNCFGAGAHWVNVLIALTLIVEVVDLNRVYVEREVTHSRGAARPPAHTPARPKVLRLSLSEDRTIYTTIAAPDKPTGPRIVDENTYKIYLGEGKRKLVAGPGKPWKTTRTIKVVPHDRTIHGTKPTRYIIVP